jgi:hypothetical protein
VIRALKRGAIASLHSERWLYETLKPGRDPMSELTRVISSLAGTTKAGDEVRANALVDKSILARWCEIALKEGREKRAVLFIDQFEEIFTQVPNKRRAPGIPEFADPGCDSQKRASDCVVHHAIGFRHELRNLSKLNALFNRQSIGLRDGTHHELANAIATCSQRRLTNRSRIGGTDHRRNTGRARCLAPDAIRPKDIRFA